MLSVIYFFTIVDTPRSKKEKEKKNHIVLGKATDSIGDPGEWINYPSSRSLPLSNTGGFYQGAY